MRLQTTLAVLIAAAALTAPAFAGSLAVGMDKQINVGMPGTDQSPSGDAIYMPATIKPNGVKSVTFETDGADGWTRALLAGDRNADSTIKNGWFYLYLDLNLAGIGSVDMSGSDTKLEFDARYFQNPQTNSNPYGDAPVFLRMYTYAANGLTYLGHRDYGITYGPKPNPLYPEWQHVSVNVNTAGTATGAWDPTKVSRIRWYGTDWSGSGDDFVDVKDLMVSGDTVTPPIPEPATLSLLLAGLPFLARRRKA